MTWEIFVGITVLFAFVVSVGKIIANNTETMTKMKCSIDQVVTLLENYHDDMEKLAEKVGVIEERVRKIEIVDREDKEE